MLLLNVPFIALPTIRRYDYVNPTEHRSEFPNFPTLVLLPSSYDRSHQASDVRTHFHKALGQYRLAEPTKLRVRGESRATEAMQWEASIASRPGFSPAHLREPRRNLPFGR
jgi:hypothetical protein